MAESKIQGPVVDSKIKGFDITIRRQRLGDAIADLANRGLIARHCIHAQDDRGLSVYIINVRATEEQIRALDEEAPHWMVGWSDEP